MKLTDRVIEISKQLGLSHIGSCCTSVGILDEIYSVKKEDEPFIASCGHMGLALYVVLEKYYGFDAEALYHKHGTHPNRDIEHKIYCSSGSLGLGITVACGMALADRSKNVYCLISDGESYEGTIWEVANVMHRYNVDNLKIFLNYNGLSAYDSVPFSHVKRIMDIFPYINVRITDVKDYGFKGLEAHYVKL